MRRESDKTSTIGIEMRRLDDRLVEEALAEARRHYTDLTVGQRLLELCDDAAEARAWTLLRRRREDTWTGSSES